MTKKRDYWIGVDGEGVSLDREDDGTTPHLYTLLAYSDADGNHDYIENHNGLSSKVCLDFLLETPPRARLAGYFLGYDWTMILKDLPNRDIYRLLRPELRLLPADEGSAFSRIEWNGFKLHFLAGMMRIQKKDRKVTVWDLGKFFQAPFVDSIVDWKIDAPHDMIANMKAQRSSFQKTDSPEVRMYCLEECKALAKLATSLEDAHEAIDLKPKTWFGPGSTASVALDKLGIREKRGDIPKEVAEAADRAFFGGRFEHSVIGTYKNVIGYDIVSAYPFQIYHLPCLQHGRWKRITHESDLPPFGEGHAVIRYHLRDIGDEPWGPLPCRMPNGNILFPRGGSTGWVWYDEWLAAQEGWEGVEWGGEAWVLQRRCYCHPFAQFLPWFRERIALGRSEKGRTLKLVLNSGYGKLAQTIGKPRYASRVWAGMITSGTRAQLLRMVCRHKDRANVLGLATDGLYSLEDLAPGQEYMPDMPLDPDTLGAWERDPHGTMTFVRPGIYWAHDELDRKKPTLRARGLGRRKLLEQREAVLLAIAQGGSFAPDGTWKDDIAHLGTSPMFGGARACIYMTASGELRRSKHFGQWHQVPARIGLTPAPKRTRDWRLHMLDNVESGPYEQTDLSKDARILQFLGNMMWGMQG